MTTNISSYDDEALDLALDLGDGFGVQRSIGTPSPGKFCCLCSKRILLGQVAHSGSNAGFSVCGDCVRCSGPAATPSSGQRPDGDDGDGGGAPSGIAVRLDFDAAAGGLPESCDGPPPGELHLQCLLCGCFRARYFSPAEEQLGHSFCLRCMISGRRLTDDYEVPLCGPCMLSQRASVTAVFEEEELPESDLES